MNMLDEVKSVFFLGIGGIGMSAIARYFQHIGIKVSGYDRTETTLTKALVAEGMTITYSLETPLPLDVDMVIYTPAVPAAHPIFTAVIERKIPLLKRAQVLGLISQSRDCVAVAGTHGKTTTSAILTHLLWSAGLECTAFLGGISNNFGSNFIQGTDEMVVVEADEYDRSFLQLHPKMLVLNALDPDHLDIYGTPEEMLQTYYKLVSQIQPGGTFLYRFDLDIPDEVKSRSDIRICTFGNEGADFQLISRPSKDGMNLFDVKTTDVHYENIAIILPGHHNALNACASFAVGLLLGLDPDLLKEGMRSFSGVNRRFTVHYEGKEVVYIDDYAHHPVEVAGVIEAARSRYPHRKITGIFQPHLYTRTRDFAAEFAEALDLLDYPVLTDLYPAREEPIPGVDSEWLLSLMNHPDKQLVPKDQLLSFIQSSELDVLITIGAGDVDHLIPQIVYILKDKYP
jgi:UDP-N-acetylmuramate--alanine ligase